MSDLVENSKEMSCSLPEPVSAEPNMSIAPVASEPLSSEPAASFSSGPSSNIDQYSNGGRLTLETQISVSNPQKFAGRSTLTVETLLAEAADSDAARDELIRALRPLSQNTRRMEMCYAGENDTLDLILAQILSPDATVRNEGRLALQHYILGTSPDSKENLRLRLGALATVARICQLHPENRDANSLLVNVYRQAPHSSPLGQGIDQLSNRSVILQAVGQANVATRSESHGGNATLLASATSAAFGGSGGVPGVDAALAYTVLPALTPTAALLSVEQSERVVEAAERALQGTHLQTIPSEEIVATVHRFLGEARDQFRQDLRRGVLGLGLRYAEFSGSHFLAHANLATRVADRIAAEIFGETSGERSGRRASRSQGDNLPGTDAVPAGTSLARNDRAPAPQGSNPVLNPGNQELVNAAELGGSFPSGHPVTTTLAGMQGAAQQGTTLAYTSASTAGYNSRPNYAVEGPTSEEAPHDGFSGGSQGGNQDDRGQEEQNHSQSQPDSYLA